MAVCSRCCKEFDLDFHRETFEIETLKNYSYLTQTLCADCALDAIESEENGIYLEVCERCKKQFDPFEAEIEFQNEHSEDMGASLSLFEEYLCLDCANQAYEEIPSVRNFLDSDL